jgi:hypothetical protein
MAKREPKQPRRARPGILPPLTVDFETALGALLKTPPPPKDNKKAAKRARKRKAARR